MKTPVLIFTLLFSLNLMAQKIALFDTKFKQPIIFTDSVTVEQTKNYFPIGVKDLDTLYGDLTYIKKMLAVRQRAKMKSFELRAGSTTLAVKRIPFSYGDRYLTTLKTKVNEIEANYILTDYNFSNSSNYDRVEKILIYMRVNKNLFKNPTEVLPKIYNIVTISD